jgi:hypothetical protein
VVVAYADDVTIFVTSPEVLPVIREAVLCYEGATGACLNTMKSKALAVEGWSTTTNVLDISYYPEIRILGFTFMSTVEQSVDKIWVNITGKVRAQTREVYCRDLCLSKRILYVHSDLLGKI